MKVMKLLLRMGIVLLVVLSLCGVAPSVAQAGGAAFVAPSSGEAFRLEQPPLGQHRLAQRNSSGALSLLGASLSQPQFGSLRQFQKTDENYNIMVWIFAVTFMAADVAAIGGNIASLFTHRHRLAWGILGVTAGGLSLIWGFFPLFTPVGILLAVPLWVVGAVTLTLGALNLAALRGRRRYRRRRRRYYRRRYGVEWNIQPWLQTNRHGESAIGYALVGTF